MNKGYINEVITIGQEKAKEVKSTKIDAKKICNKIGLKNKQPIPILFNEDGRSLRKRKTGKCVLEIESGVVSTGIDSKGNQKKGYAYKNEYIIDVPLSQLSKDNIFSNENNPREGYFTTERIGIVDTILNRPNAFIASVQGCCIGAINVNLVEKSKGRKQIEFEIPYLEKVEGETEEEVKKRENYNKRYGLFEGQHLFYICVSVAEAVRSGVITEITEKDLDNIYLRMFIQEYNDDIPLETLVHICNAKNTVVPQKSTAICMQAGDLDEYFYSEIRNGIEKKDAEGLYALIEEEMIENKESDIDRIYFEDKMKITDYFKHIEMVDLFRKSKNENLGSVKKCQNSKNFKSGMGKAKSSRAFKSIVDAKRTYDLTGDYVPVTFEGSLNEEVAVFHCKNIDFAMSYDYKNHQLKEVTKGEWLEALDYLGITSVDETNKNLNSKIEKRKVSPFYNNDIKFNLPVSVLNIIPLITAGLLVEKNGVILGSMPVEEFWSKYCERIIMDLRTIRGRGAKENHDSWCMCNIDLNYTAKVWRDIFMDTRVEAENYVSERKALS